MTISAFLPLLIVVILIIGTMLASRLDKAAQPLRLELAEKGEWLLASKETPAEVRSAVTFMLDSAFGYTVPLLFGVIALPIFAILVAAKPSILARVSRDYSKLDSETRNLLEDCARLHDKITLANHPLLQTLVELQLVFFTPLILLGIAIRSDPLPAAVDRRTVLNVLEMKEVRLISRIVHAH